MRFGKITAIVFLALLGIALSSTSVHAFTNETCTVGSVWFAPVISPIGAANDVLSIGCRNDNTFYYLEAGTQVQSGGCFADIDAVKALEAIALTARITGNPLTIPYYTANCPGLNTVRVFTELGI